MITITLLTLCVIIFAFIGLFSGNDSIEEGGAGTAIVSVVCFTISHLCAALIGQITK